MTRANRPLPVVPSHVVTAWIGNSAQVAARHHLQVTDEEIVNKLRRADVELARGQSVAAVCKLIEVTEATYYRWRREYGGMKVWTTSASRSVGPLFIEPGSPWENGYCESFNSKLADDLLDREIFYTLGEAKVLIERWRVEYNTVRPHSSLGYRPPAPEHRGHANRCILAFCRCQYH